MAEKTSRDISRGQCLFGQKDISGSGLGYPEIPHDMSISVYVGLSQDTSGYQIQASHVGISQFIYGHVRTRIFKDLVFPMSVTVYISIPLDMSECELLPLNVPGYPDAA